MSIQFWRHRSMKGKRETLRVIGMDKMLNVMFMKIIFLPLAQKIEENETDRLCGNLRSLLNFYRCFRIQVFATYAGIHFYGCF